jgi:hypothetical protein
MSSYIFGVNYSASGPTLDFMLDVTDVTQFKSYDEFKATLDVRKRMDPSDTSLNDAARKMAHMGFFMKIRPRFTDDGGVYKIDYDGDELSRDQLEQYLQSLPKEELKTFLAQAKI